MSDEWRQWKASNQDQSNHRKTNRAQPAQQNTPVCPPSTNSTPPRTDEAELVSPIKDIALPLGCRDKEDG
jgi:hypothetical protein